MKKLSKTVVVFILGVLLAFTIDVAAEAVISSGAVSYSNAATSETTVSGALDELFSTVDINKKIGDISKISTIGDGTITDSILEINNNLLTTVETLKENVTIIRQGKKRTLICKGALTDYVSVLLQLDSRDWPFEYTYNNLLMLTNDTFYLGYFRITDTGLVNVYWYEPGGNQAVIGNEQIVFGQIEWYVS